jgi:phospholipase C
LRLALIVAGIFGFATSCHSSTSPLPAAPPGLIQHVVIIVQENRSVDDLFNGFPGADTVMVGQTSTGQAIALRPVSLAAPYDLGHGHGGFELEYNDGAMNGFDLEQIIPAPGFTPPPDAAYGYVPHVESAPLFALGEEFTFADRMFETNQGPSFPAHQFIISGTSAPTATSDLLAAENVIFPPGVSSSNSGCDSPPGSKVQLIDPIGLENTEVFPCFDHPTLPDLLDAANLSWRYYTPNAYFLWTGPEAISHLRYGSDWANVTVPETRIFDDIEQGRLPTVSWVIPTGANSDHAGKLSDTGPSWVASVVNAIGQSAYWNHTAIFVTWDDWGGWYDHVKPPIYNSYELGFRVPLLVISPYAKAGYVSHVQHEFGSILHFTEEQFGLKSLGYTDSRADDLSDCFNFSQPALRFRPVQTRYSKEQLLEQWKESPPDND